MTSVIKDVFIKKINSIKRDRYCKCGFLFSTFEKFQKSSKLKKSRPSSLWKNDRILWYAIARYNSYLKALKKAFQKIKLKRKVIFKNNDFIYHIYNNKHKLPKFKNKKDFLNYTRKESYNSDHNVKILNIKGKSWLEVKYENKPKVKVKIDDKKQTISNIIKNPDYWWLREFYFPNKENTDRLDKDKFRKEIEEFYKSVCSYVTELKYNQDFFIQNNPEAETWKNSQTWQIYTKIR